VYKWWHLTSPKSFLLVILDSLNFQSVNYQLIYHLRVGIISLSMIMNVAELVSLIQVGFSYSYVCR